MSRPYTTPRLKSLAPGLSPLLAEQSLPLIDSDDYVVTDEAHVFSRSHTLWDDEETAEEEPAE